MKAKKSLGQHFLKSKSAIKKIIETADLTADDIVLEIGPGKGVLTAALLSSPAKKVITIEKDGRMIPFLEEKFQNVITEKRLVLEKGDAILFEPKT